MQIKFELFLLSGKSRNSYNLLHIRIKTNFACSAKESEFFNCIGLFCFCFFFLFLKDESNH